MAARDHRPSFRGVPVPVRCAKLVLALLAVANAVLIALTLLNHNRRQAAAQATQPTYLGDSFPARQPPLSALPPVNYTLEPSTRYPPTPAALPRWLASLPRQLGYVRLGPRRRIFALSMSHAAHCVYLFARAIALADGGGAPSEAHLQHCMNYVRQHVLCEADATLEEPGWVESVEAGAWGTVGAAGAPRERACRDWRVVYDAVEEDYRRWMEYRAQNWEGD